MQNESMLFEDIEGVPVPRLASGPDGTPRVCDGRTFFDLERAAGHFHLSKARLRLIWQDFTSEVEASERVERLDGRYIELEGPSGATGFQAHRTYEALVLASAIIQAALALDRLEDVAELRTERGRVRAAFDRAWRVAGEYCWAENVGDPTSQGGRRLRGAAEIRARSGNSRRRKPRR